MNPTRENHLLVKCDSQEFKQQLAYMLVHDLRNPSTTITMIAETLLKRGEVNDFVQEGLLDILETARCVNRRVDNLLTIGKASDGRLPLCKNRVDGKELVQNTVNSLVIIAESRGCQLSFQGPNRPCFLTIDADLMGRVLENLIVNAIKFSPAGGNVKLHIDQSRSSGKPKTVIQVIDEGCGLPETNRQVIFEPFQIGQSIEGILQTGLGLAFCKLAVEAHSGHILVENNVPQGTIFSVVL